MNTPWVKPAIFLQMPNERKKERNKDIYLKVFSFLWLLRRIKLYKKNVPSCVSERIACVYVFIAILYQNIILHVELNGRKCPAADVLSVLYKRSMLRYTLCSMFKRLAM